MNRIEKMGVGVERRKLPPQERDRQDEVRDKDAKTHHFGAAA